jgi:hypothetical protein
VPLLGPRGARLRAGDGRRAAGGRRGARRPRDLSLEPPARTLAALGVAPSPSRRRRRHRVSPSAERHARRRRHETSKSVRRCAQPRHKRLWPRTIAVPPDRRLVDYVSDVGVFVNVNGFPLVCGGGVTVKTGPHTATRCLAERALKVERGQIPVKGRGDEVQFRSRWCGDGW